jgi:hypothetical protein
MLRSLRGLQQLCSVCLESSGALASRASYRRVPSESSPVIRELDVQLPSSVKELIPPLEVRKPEADSLRTGLIGVKVGMVSEWDEYGKLTPFTVLWFDENQVWVSSNRSESASSLP